MRSGFGQFCPVAVACEVFGERWTPIILRELLAGAEQFNTLHRGIPRISRPLLAKRLRELEKAGVVRKEPLPRGREIAIASRNRAWSFAAPSKPSGPGDSAGP